MKKEIKSGDLVSGQLWDWKIAKVVDVKGFFRGIDNAGCAQISVKEGIVFVPPKTLRRIKIKKKEPITIYVVMGTTGEYSNRIEWEVKAFRSKDSAEEFIIAATLQVTEKYASNSDPYDQIVDGTDLDPKALFSYTGTEYFYYSMKLE